MTEIMYHRFYAHLVPLIRAAARALNCVFSPTARLPGQPQQPSFGNYDSYSCYSTQKSIYVIGERDGVCVCVCVCVSVYAYYIRLRAGQRYVEI